MPKTRHLPNLTATLKASVAADTAPRENNAPLMRNVPAVAGARSDMLPRGKQRKIKSAASKTKNPPPAAIDTTPAPAATNTKIEIMPDAARISNPEQTFASEPSERALARQAARAAVAAYYSGISMPFKAAVDLKIKSPINFGLTKNPSARSAALLAAIVTYCDVQSDGTFVRGSGRVPGRLIGRTGADANRLFSAGPESGGLSNLMPDRVQYISGALSGAGCENAIFRLNFAAARANMLAFNNKLPDGSRTFTAPLRLLTAIEKRAVPQPEPEPAASELPFNPPELAPARSDEPSDAGFDAYLRELGGTVNP